MSSSRIHLLFLIGIFFAISGCKKDKDPITIDVEGTIYDKNTGSPLSGTSVKIQSQGISGGTYSSNWSTIDQTTTSSLGTYSFTFERENVNQYRILAEKAGYFTGELIVNSDDVSIETTNTFDLEIASLSWFSIHIVNANPFDSTDYMTYQNKSGLLSCGSVCCNATLKNFEGTDIDTVLTCQTEGGQYLSFQASWVKNGIPQSITDSVYLPVNDTAFYQLNY